jgi:Tfp pilus assembly protein PilN
MLNVDFLPERVIQQRARRRRLMRQGWLLLLCVALMAGLAFVRHGRIRQARAERDVWTERSENARQQVELRKELEREQASLSLKKRIDDQLGTRISARDLLAELCRLLPTSMSLTSMEMEEVRFLDDGSADAGGRSARARRAKGREATPARHLQVVIQGLAPNDVDVANFIGRLSACPLFESVQMGYTRTQEFRGREAREFEATFFVAR